MILPDSQSPRGFVRQALLFEGSLGVAALVAGIWMRDPAWRQIRWSPAAAGWGLVATVPMIALMWLLRQVRTGPFGRLNRVVDEFVVPLFAGISLGQIAAIALVAGTCEELLFRGTIQTALAGWLGLAAAVVLTNVLFGLIHFVTPLYAVWAAIIGAFFSGLWWYFDRNLLTPIVAHAVYDFVALVYFDAAARMSAARLRLSKLPSRSQLAGNSRTQIFRNRTGLW